MAPAEIGVATDLPRALVIPTVDGVAVVAEEFKDVNVAAVLKVFREAEYAKLERDLEGIIDACEMLAARVVVEGGEVAAEDGREEVLVVLDHWEAPPEVLREIQELPDDDGSDPWREYIRLELFLGVLLSTPEAFTDIKVLARPVVVVGEL